MSSKTVFGRSSKTARDSRSDDPSSDDEPKASCLVSVAIRIAVAVKPVVGEVKPILMVEEVIVASDELSSKIAKVSLKFSSKA